MTDDKIHAPLGSTRLRYSSRLHQREQKALARIEAWFDQHPDSFITFSGGKDSLVCLHLARQIHPHVPVAFYDSGLEFPQTLRYIEQLRAQWGLQVHTFPAEPSALTVLANSGMWEYGATKEALDVLHHACIERPSRAARAALGRASIIGLRADESSSRRALLSRNDGYTTRHARDGSVEESKIAPIWQWSWEDVYAYIGTHQLPMNPIYREFQRLGEPARRIRVGLLVDGWALERGRWALACRVAPELCRVVETHLPMLANWR